MKKLIILYIIIFFCSCTIYVHQCGYYTRKERKEILRKADSIITNTPKIK